LKPSAVIYYRNDKEKEARNLSQKISSHILINQICQAEEQVISKGCDFVIVVGGDGTVIKVAKFTTCPIIGFKAGRVGFLASYKLEEIDRFLKDLSQQRLLMEKRFMLTVKVNEVDYDAVNDVVFHLPSRRMGEFRLSFDGCSDLLFFADGILISTATGSTAYNLSLGGAIVTPVSEVIQIMPIAPYYLQNRSIVVPNEQRITVDTLNICEVIVDGVIVGKVNSITVQKSNKHFTLLRPDYYDFFAVLKDKVGYGKGVTNEVDRG